MEKPRNIEFKGATDLVTDTDKASEEAVLSVSYQLPLPFLQTAGFTWFPASSQNNSDHKESCWAT